MSKLDDELAKALAASEEPAGQVAPEEAEPQVDPSLRNGAARDGKKKGLGLLVVLLTMGSLILFIVFTSKDEAIYSATVDQLIVDAARFEGRNIKVEGELVKGSLKHRQEPCEYRFVLSKNGEEIPVRYAECIVPDTFRDVPDMDVQVTAEGRLDTDGHFAATHIMAKCPSKYEMQNKAATGQTAPHELMAAPIPIN
jgi:cytochrome c-type biogenesis protein CcmE